MGESTKLTLFTITIPAGMPSSTTKTTLNINNIAIIVIDITTIIITMKTVVMRKGLVVSQSCWQPHNANCTLATDSHRHLDDDDECAEDDLG